LDLFSAEEAVHYLLARVAERQHEDGDEQAARKLAEELGFLPLALEQAASFLTKVSCSFEQYREYLRDARPKLLSYEAEGGTRYPASVAKTWSLTLEWLSSLSRALLRLAAWLAPEAIPRGLFTAEEALLSEMLGVSVDVSRLSIDLALAELDGFSLVRLTSKTVSVHRLLQAVERDSLSGEDCERWLDRASRFFNAFAPASPGDARTWDVWLSLAPHAEALLEHTKRHVIDTLPIALMVNQFGLFLLARAEYAQAEPMFRRALAIYEKALGPEHPDVATSLNNLAELYHDQGQYGKAEPLHERALAIHEKALGPEHPDVATSLNNLAQLHKRRGQYARAEPLYERALVIYEKALGPEHPEVATSLNNLAGLYHDQGQYGKAEPLYQRSLPIWEKALRCRL
jgi:tetratricopeptide (TPR) repeat protein